MRYRFKENLKNLNVNTINNKINGQFILKIDSLFDM